jgi:serine/threonine protein kinase
MAEHLVGPYRTLRELGRGGMGVVYEAVHRGDGQRVALKLLLQPAHAEEIDLVRFEREIAACASLQHPNLVHYHGAGLHRGWPFLAMEYVEGETLSERLKRTGPMEPEAAVRLVAALARGLASAHALAILHRDIKPDNVMLRGDQPVLTDFGLALTGGSELQRLTNTGVVLGTPTYMAPEQADGEQRAMCPATDVYSLGALLYTLLSGLPPFTGGSLISILHKVVSEPAQPPSRVREGVSAELDQVCLRCLAKDPAERYADAAEFAEALEALAPQESVRAGVVSAGLVGRLVAGLVGGLVVAALALALMLGGRQSPSSAPSPSSSASSSRTDSPARTPEPSAKDQRVAKALHTAAGHVSTRRYAAARRALTSLPEAERSVGVWLLLGRVESRFLLRANASEARRAAYTAFSKGLALAGQDARAARVELLVRRAQIRDRPSGDPDPKQDYRGAAELGEAQGLPLSLYARSALLDDGDPERQLELLKRAFVSNKGALVSGRLVGLLYARAWKDWQRGGDPSFERAFEIARAAVEHNADDPWFRHILGGHLKQVVQEGFCKLPPPAWPGLERHLGRSYEDVFREADANFTRALELEPEWISPLLERGYLRFIYARMLGDRGILDNALADLGRASREWDHGHASFTYALVLGEARLLREALRAIRRALELSSPPSPQQQRYYQMYVRWAFDLRDGAALRALDRYAARDLKSAPAPALHRYLTGLRQRIASVP